MVETDVQPLKDVNIIQSSHIWDLNSEPPNEIYECDSDPKQSQGQLEAQEIKDSPKKRKLNKIEMVSVKGTKNNNQVSFKSSLRSLYLPGGNKNREAKNQHDSSSSSSLSQQESNHGPISKSELGRRSKLILMGCTNCYLYAMVCDDNPKCPKCHKGDCLLDKFRENPVMKDNIM